MYYEQQLHCTRTNLRAHAKLGCFGNLDVRGHLGYPSCPKSSLANSEIQVESRIMESILVFGGEIRKNFAVYTPPKTRSHQEGQFFGLF